ncbi:MAG: alpha/beta hydrolase [Alphaproteobacteria bacterium]
MNTPVQKETKQTDLPRNLIDPEIREFILQMEKNYEQLTPKTKMTPTLRREIAEKARQPFRTGGPEMVKTETIMLDSGNVRIRVYTPKIRTAPNAQQPVLLYVHGGGWVMFSIDTHDRLMREYADQTGFAVVGIDYSLSPEHVFPRALDDIDTVYEWVFSNAGANGWDAQSIYIGGDSAGGNLSLCSTLRRRDNDLPLPQGLLLNYAALDTETRPSYQLYDGEPFVLSCDEMAAFWLDYLGAPNTENPYARPLLADLTGLPPVHSCIAECDILRDENLELLKRLKEANVDVSSIIYEGATHSFLEAMSVSSLARRAIEDAAGWLKNKAI